MTRDYAKRPTAYARKKEPKRGSFLTIIVVAVAILLPLSLLYLKHFHGLHHSLHLSQARQKIRALEKAAKNDDLVQFDFYTVLPNREVEISRQQTSESHDQKASIQPTSPKATAPHPTTAVAISKTQPIKNEGFFLQTAASRNYSDAQRFVSQLSSVEPHLFIQQIKVDHVFWYRIMAGPYATHEEAIAAQQRLKQYKIRSILAKSKKN